MTRRLSLFVGIDPGLDGAIACLSVGKYGNFEKSVVWDTPTLTAGRGRRKRRHYEIPKMVAILKQLGKPELVVLEAVHSMPKQGVRSMFSMGLGLGIWQGVLSTLSYPVELVTPHKWKTYMVGTGVDKEASRLRALELFPEQAEQLSHKRDHGRAEALLLAEYGKRFISKQTM